MKNRIIRERYAALVALSRRVLPSVGAVNKVSALLATRFRRAYDATEDSRKQIIAQHPTAPDWDGDEIPPPIAEARQRQMDELLEMDTPIGKVPDRLRLTADDLPKMLKRDGGEDNVASLAEIKVMLGSLYVLSAEELALREADADVDHDAQEPE